MSNAPAFIERDWEREDPLKMPQVGSFWRGLLDSKTPSSYFVPELVKQRVEEDPYAFVPVDTPVNELRRQYEFRHRNEVKDYLERNPALNDVLRKARDEIAEQFGPETCAVLDVIKDGEMDNKERLFVFVQTSLGADEALDSLDEFYERWWLDVLSRIQPKVSVDVEFI